MLIPRFKTTNFSLIEVIHNTSGITQDNLDDIIMIGMYQMGVLQTLRDAAKVHFGKEIAIKITSGYRSEVYNKSIRGSTDSFHIWKRNPSGTFRCAVDTWTKDIPLEDWFSFVARQIHGEVYMHRTRRLVHIATEQNHDETFIIE